MIAILRRVAILALVAVLGLANAAPASAQAPYIVVDLDTGLVLGARDAGELWYPASLTKLMTVYLVFEAIAEGRLQFNSPVTITERAHAEPPSRMGFPVGTVVTVDNALKMLLVKSANDIAIAVAEMMGGTVANFVADMNRAAQRLGLTGTRFVNPHGLPAAGQSTNARDMAVLGAALWTRFPQYRGYFAIGSIRYGSTIMPSPNSLLEYYEGANGMKTGYICASGYNVVGTATHGGQTLLVVVLGEVSMVGRAVTAAQLLDAGFALSPTSPRAPLATFTPASTRAAAADLRSTYCPNGTTEADELLNLDILLTAAMGPKVVVADIIAVTTGGADMAAALRVDVPLPRPRPSPFPADALGVTAAQPAPLVPPLPRPRPAI